MTPTPESPRICRGAGVNRERLHANLGSKRQLFETVLAEKLASALDAHRP